jgi:hypothetical protein
VSLQGGEGKWLLARRGKRIAAAVSSAPPRHHGAFGVCHAIAREPLVSRRSFDGPFPALTWALCCHQPNNEYPSARGEKWQVDSVKRAVEQEAGVIGRVWLTSAF